MPLVTFLENGVDPTSPLLYRITIGDQFYYIGCANSSKRPKRAYALNLKRQIDGKAYRKTNAQGFRLVHRKMLEAHREGTPY